jgi:hypothetical protein
MRFILGLRNVGWCAFSFATVLCALTFSGCGSSSELDPAELKKGTEALRETVAKQEAAINAGVKGVRGKKAPPIKSIKGNIGAIQ